MQISFRFFLWKHFQHILQSNSVILSPSMWFTSIFSVELHRLVFYLIFFFFICCRIRTNNSNTVDTSWNVHNYKRWSACAAYFHNIPFPLQGSFRCLWSSSWDRSRLSQSSADNSVGEREHPWLIPLWLQAGTHGWQQGMTAVEGNLVVVPCCHFSVPQTVWLSQWLTDWFLWWIAAVISPPEDHKSPAVVDRTGWNV